MTRLLILTILVGYLCFSADASIGEAEDIEGKWLITSIIKPEAAIAVDTKKLLIPSDIAKAVGKTNYTQGKATITLGIDEEVDAALSTISKDLLLNYDPVSVPDQEISFEYKPLLITYNGKLNLNDGRLQELSALTRNGDAILVHTLDTEVSKILIPVNFKHLIVRYDFRMKVKGDTVEGLEFAWLNNVQGVYSFEIRNSEILSRDFSLDVGDLEIDVYSNAISRTYTKLVSKLTTDPLSSVALEYARSIVGSYVSSAIISELGLVEADSK